MRRFCAICGKFESEDEPLIDNLCWSCYRARHKLIRVPSRLEVEVCSSCGAYRVNGRWVECRTGNPAFEASAEAVRRSVKLAGRGSFKVVPEAFRGKGRVVVRIIASGSVHPSIPEYEEEAVVEVEVKRVSCPICIKMASKYYVATVQVRAEDRQLTRNEVTLICRLVENLVSREIESDRSAYIVEAKRVTGGFDFKFASTRIAKLIASRIKDETGAMLKETFKVIGVEKSTGKRLSRLTISVRLPPFTFGDVIRVGSSIIRFEGFRGGRFFGLDLRSWRRCSISYKAVWSGEVEKIASMDELPTAVVLSAYGDTVQLMDLSSYEVYEVERPEELEVKLGSEVRFIKLNGKIYIVGFA
ncbi:MAG: hypothetical protein DRJ18_03275 [Candidatus Methanomethylicota archaeon]|nr:MAG: hypothetical protein DRJ18_03275 [Candidatus Verstraetearchaeota archaeon]